MTMKFLLSVIFVTNLVIVSMSQPNTFKITNQDLIWQKVYESDLTQDEIKKAILAAGAFFLERETENSLQVSFASLKPDIKGAGFNKISMAGYVTQNNLNGYATIEFKEGRYRVTVNNIDLVLNKDVYFENMLIHEKGKIEDLEKYTINRKKETYKAAFKSKPGIVYDYTFNKLFEIKTISLSSDW